MDTDESFYPSDIAAQISNTYPTIDQDRVTNPPSPLTLNNLNDLNNYGTQGTNVYLHSNEGITSFETTPWMIGVRPSSDGSTPGAVGSVIISVPKANSIVDVFYFSFYAFNQGNRVFEDPNLEFGNHVGDWEHTAIRFNVSSPLPTPISMWFSQHSTGQAFAWNALEKQGLRPVAYSAKGTHANYAIGGPHDHTLSNGINGIAGPLIDHTSQGVLWDPIKNAWFYEYDAPNDRFLPISANANNSTPPVNWLYFNGRWGDPNLPDSDKHQVNLFGQRKFSAGPTGPRDKNLGRQNICPDGKQCTIRPILTPRDVE
jgi:hypothetical protein